MANTTPDPALTVLEQFIQAAGSDHSLEVPPAAAVPETVQVAVCLVPDMDVGTGVPP